MFAFALWDRRQRQLHLVRDRFGEKPLYYGWAAGNFVFASELKAIRALEGLDNAIDRRSVRLLSARSYIPAPLSIYRRLFKLPPGSILTADADAFRHPLDDPPAPGGRAGSISIRSYWSYRQVVLDRLAEPIADEEEALERLEHSLSTAIKGQSVADVPVGVFLSGGIDSSTVVALYQKHSSRAVRTFSIGFEEAGFDEAGCAKRVAAQLGSEHNERYVTVHEAQQVIPLLPAMYDEPFADSSQIPTFLVSRFAREQVTVALTGDGGDELFAGYNRHFAAPHLWQQLRRVPQPLRSAIGLPLSWLSSQFWNSAAGLLPGRRPQHLGGKIQKGLRVAGSVRNFDDRYSSFLDEWSFEKSPVRGGDTIGPGWDMGLRQECAGHAANDVLRRGLLLARRHPVQSGSRIDGGEPRNPRAVSRSSRGRARRPNSSQHEGARRDGEVYPPQAPPSGDSARAVRPAQGGLCDPRGGVD